MPRNNPCSICTGGIPCEDCLRDPQNSTPVKLYTPKGAARAMMAGKVLKGRWGAQYFWENQGEDGAGFRKRHDTGTVLPAFDLSGLYEELT
jgi:hypothetical protein